MCKNASCNALSRSGFEFRVASLMDNNIIKGELHATHSRARNMSLSYYGLQLHGSAYFIDCCFVVLSYELSLVHSVSGVENHFAWFDDAG